MCRRCWEEWCALCDRDHTLLPPWASRNGDALTGAILGAFLGYLGGHLLAGPDVALWGMLAGGACGMAIGWGRGR